MVLAICLLFLVTALVRAESSNFSQLKRSYMEWPDVMAVGETYPMQAFRDYYSGSTLLKRENVTDKLVYISTDEKVVRVLPGNILKAVGPGVCSLRIEETDKSQIWRTSKTISVAASTFNHSTADRSKNEIVAKYKANKAQFSFNEYNEQFTQLPSADSPYSLGNLKDGMLLDGLRTANFVRYLAGLPDRLVLDQQLNRKAQHGALVLAANDELTHEPRKPLAMNRAFYDIGYQSTTSSNISSGVDTFSEQVVGFMDDIGIHNLEAVGHRRWILHPPLKNIGFGLAYTRQSVPYGVMQVFDTSDATNTKVNYDYIAWPSAGFFPTQYFNTMAPWSFTPNPMTYDLSQSTKLSVELTDEQGKRTWTLNQYDSAVSDNDDFFNIDVSKGDYASAVVFRPSEAQYRDGDTYRVAIRGLMHRVKGPVDVSYEVNFFAIPNWQRPDGWSRERSEIATGMIADDNEQQGQTADRNNDGSDGDKASEGEGGASKSNAEVAKDSGAQALWNQTLQTASSITSSAYQALQDQLTGLKNWLILVIGLCSLIIALLLFLYLLRKRN